MRILLSLIILLSNVAYADSIRFGGWSKHLDNSYDYNEAHNAFVYENDEYGAVVGYYYNSYRQDTYLLGRQWKWNLTEDVTFRFTAGAVYGYGECYGEGDGSTLCPALVPEVRIEGWKLRPSFLILGEAGAITLGLEF